MRKETSMSFRLGFELLKKLQDVSDEADIPQSVIVRNGIKKELAEIMREIEKTDEER